MSRALAVGRLFFATALAFAASAVLSPAAHADIIEVEAATGCPGSVGGGLCAPGGHAFDLDTLLDHGINLSSGTQKFVVKDTTGSFSFIYTGSSGDNGSCQINGGAAALFGSCSGRNFDHTLFSLGHDDTDHPGLNGPTIITFIAKPGECTHDHPCFFDFGFVSWQGQGTGTTMPEPASLALLSTGLLGFFSLRRRLT